MEYTHSQYNSVESIYYHPNVQSRVAERYASVTGEAASVRIADAKNAAIGTIRSHIQRLSERTAEKTSRDLFFKHVPGKKEIVAGIPIGVSLDVAAIVMEERERLENWLDTDNLVEIIARYPIRETSALTEIARKLGFQDRKQYEGAVRKLLMDDTEALEFVRSLFGTLGTDLYSS